MVELTNEDGTPKITCNNADCENDKHCFRPKRSAKAWNDPTGDCQYCGEQPVDWDRVHRRDVTDLPALRDELRKEWIRNYFWTKELDDRSKEKLSAMSRQEIREALRLELSKCVGPPQPFKDGQRVPILDDKLIGKPFAYAQHATASCCTRCAYYWWGYERKTQYSDDQINFLAEMCLDYLEDRGAVPPEEGL